VLGAGDEAFLLGCTCPFGPAVGLVDAMRVGPDIGQVWFDGLQPSVRHGLRLALPRFFMHRRFWLNDPDCLVVRDNNSTLTLDEARFLASGVALSGGLVVLARDAKTGAPAGGGLCVAPHDGITELTSIGVREAFRRRGIAAALAGWLAQAALDRGLIVFLMAAGPDEARIYARAGFVEQGEVLHISL